MSVREAKNRHLLRQHTLIDIGPVVQHQLHKFNVSVQRTVIRAVVPPLSCKSGSAPLSSKNLAISVNPARRLELMRLFSIYVLDVRICSVIEQQFYYLSMSILGCHHQGRVPVNSVMI